MNNKPRFRQTRVVSGREARRMGERERNREQRQKAVDAFWALPPGERQKRMEDNETFRRIQRNGITLEDMKQAEERAYNQGVRAGIDSTTRTAFAAICLALHDLYGFGKVRCARVLNAVDEKIVMALTSDDAIQEVYDTMKLKIEFREDLPGDRVQEVG